MHAFRLTTESFQSTVYLSPRAQRRPPQYCDSICVPNERLYFVLVDGISREACVFEGDEQMFPEHRQIMAVLRLVQILKVNVRLRGRVHVG